MTVQSYSRLIDALEASGRIGFTVDDLVEEARAPRPAVLKGLTTVRRSGRLRSPTRGFNVIVPAVYRDRGDVPVDWFLDDWMAYVGRRYRVSGLTAASRHGAGHQAAQTYDVVIDRALASGAKAWPKRLRFFVDGTERPTKRVETPYAPLHIATAETCAFDLVTWMDRFAGPSHVATVLAELRLDSAALQIQARERPVSVVRRLGFLLERFQFGLHTELLLEVAAGYDVPTPLVVSSPHRGELDRRWNVLVNASVEIDQL